MPRSKSPPSSLLLLLLHSSLISSMLWGVWAREDGRGGTSSLMHSIIPLPRSCHPLSKPHSSAPPSTFPCPCQLLTNVSSPCRTPPGLGGERSTEAQREAQVTFNLMRMQLLVLSGHQNSPPGPVCCLSVGLSPSSSTLNC